ncbi:hypothetical protein N7495_003683 [Penicillium taxi]|uniref:uncharacterized protein n=1 Tax=Penicillium taxi TaxID=168475 RepID=UPI0025458159|nr:uncharacterized protein N7495_003683 [Penicillium taxi]KAJ5898939.1 hypothetical protein N7495_003683 [Penicillium taxi]
MSATSANRRESWDSMSSSFAHLEVSFSHDSSYGSDEVSVSSNTPTTLDSCDSTCIVKPSFHPLLKSILKNSTADIQKDTESDSDSESAYVSDEIDSDYDALSEVEDSDDDDNMSDFSVWDEEATHDAPQSHEDHTEQFDDSFIGFGSCVCFDPKVEYIETLDLEFSEDESSDNSSDESPVQEMTCHEMMLLAQQSSSLQISIHQLDDFTLDAVDTDRNIFVAFMNGLHGIDDKKYKNYLHTQAENIRQGRQSESMHPDDVPCLFLESLTAHVVGTFRHLLEKGEMEDLVSLHQEDQKESLQEIERFLRDRLMDGSIEVSPDELSFLAGGVEKTLGV